jgi:hypothetical protein
MKDDTPKKKLPPFPGRWTKFPSGPLKKDPPNHRLWFGWWHRRFEHGEDLVMVGTQEEG